MKIVLFTRSLDVGGTQRQLAALAAGLARRGHDIVVIVLYSGGAIEVALEGSGARLVGLGKSGRWDIFGPMSRLWRMFRSEAPDLIYSFLPTQTVLSALLAPKGRRTRLVFGIRAAGMKPDEYDMLSAMIYRLEVGLSRRADLIIANAGAGRLDAIAKGMPADRIAVVPNGIDVDAMRPDEAAGRTIRRQWKIPDDAFVVGMVARLDPMKDHETFLAAAVEFARAHEDAYFVCVGAGPEALRQKLESRAHSLGLTDRVVWVGESSDVRAAYDAFDIATLSSAFGEGFPNAVAEALACGVPVVATDLGDVASIIGECGEVVPPRRPDLLNAGWGRVRARLEQDPNMGAAGRDQIVKNFSVDAMVQRTEEILSRVSAGRPAIEIVREFA